MVTGEPLENTPDDRSQDLLISFFYLEILAVDSVDFMCEKQDIETPNHFPIVVP
jgi:hypothetical protein